MSSNQAAAREHDYHALRPLLSSSHVSDHLEELDASGNYSASDAADSDSDGASASGSILPGYVHGGQANSPAGFMQRSRNGDHARRHRATREAAKSQASAKRSTGDFAHDGASVWQSSGLNEPVGKFIARPCSAFCAGNGWHICSTSYLHYMHARHKHTVRGRRDIVKYTITLLIVLELVNGGG